ncbi:CadC-family transcriptional regulator [Lysobacter dokdonensis DS-58]|uniref:CadC-family transcriptional regulator n=1 Tax=Lysobacter dokdonensis DS-58 TaxID=1300345 RepID=A0A0A2WLN3_9GAMM|nr:winged helix-turn-helix domain-containing protein [Lysobacter dokdonensis]KGQ20693.1 CadC-family transcriptional regulator [Lysobacter dokdonensis DS-58]
MSDAAVYRFDSGELDGARHRLRIGGQAVELEPKAFAVLEDLLAHAGTLRSRDDLLDAVWGHRHVTPAVLNRCIGQVRKALGDHAESPRYIQTVHTLGYRFIAPVEVVPEAAATDASDVPRKRRIGWMVAAAIAGVALVAVVAWRSRDGASAPGEVVARAPTQVVLVRFAIPPQAAGIAPQVRALEASVLQRLRMLPGLRVERGLARDDAIVLAGDVVGPAPDWRLRIRVRHAATPFERAYPLQLATLGETAIGVQTDVARLVRPDSATLLAPGGALDAGESIRSGLRARAGLKQRDRDDAIIAFQRALQIDPTNADAWCHLGGMHLLRVSENLASKDTVIPAASEAIERGLRLDPASSACLVQQGELLRLRERFDEAERAYRRALALEPTLMEPRLALVMMDGDRGHYARVRDGLERIVSEHPEKGWPHCELIGAYEATGEPDKARAFEATVYARHPRLRDVNWYSPSVDMMYGRPAAGIRRYQQIAAIDPDDHSYSLVTAYVAAWLGDTALAKAELDRAGVLDTSHYLQAHAWLFFALGDPEGASTWLRSAQVSPSLALYQRALQAQSLALAGHRDAALREYARVYEGGWRDDDPVEHSGAGPGYASHLLNYAALLPPGPTRTDAIASAARHLANKRANGLGLPWVDYQAAQIAVMQGDRAAAMAALDRAIDAGYTDVLSLYRDLPWRMLDDDPAFEQRKARLAAIAQAQRRLLTGDGADTASVVAR